MLRATVLGSRLCIDTTVYFLQESFDKDQAANDGLLLPDEGVDQEYDNAIREIKEIENQLSEYRKKQEKIFGCKVSIFYTAMESCSLENRTF